MLSVIGVLKGVLTLDGRLAHAFGLAPRLLLSLAFALLDVLRELPLVVSNRSIKVVGMCQGMREWRSPLSHAFLRNNGCPLLVKVL
jgi:hypothetical protein